MTSTTKAGRPAIPPAAGSALADPAKRRFRWGLPGRWLMLAVAPAATRAVPVAALPAWNADHDGNSAPLPPAWPGPASVAALAWVGADWGRFTGRAERVTQVAANELQAALFADRRMAGRLLGECLRKILARTGNALESAHGGPLVLALPRGGVAVAREVADALGLPVDVLVTRKIGHPGQPELGVGAIAEGGEPVYDGLLLSKLGLTRAGLRPVAERERAELHRRVRVYRGGRPPPDVAGRPVILVDDGLATGVTARAALRSLRARSAGRTVLAVPVAAPSSMGALSGEADDLIALAAPATFKAVGEWYTSFTQLTDSDVLKLLGRSQDAGGKGDES